MNYGPLVFLTAFLALSASWFGFVLAPQIQLGRQQPESSVVNKAQLYPQGRPGVARQGAEVYRANGCASCHSQQVRQTGVMADIVLTDAGANPVGLADELMNANLGLTNLTGPGLAGGLPKAIVRGVPVDQGRSVVGILKTAGAKGDLQIVPVGPDIARRWGARRTVAADFIYDSPVMLGSQRIGPDLANVGARWPDANWHLRHLYAPRLEVPGSPMPPARYLFERRKITGHPSADALQLSPELAPPPGFEIVPKPEARALVAYLLSLRIETPLAEAPAPAPPAPPTDAANTNAPAK
jgi:cbb3-type cytochrome oxidase cytochrome c subunit